MEQCYLTDAELAFTLDTLDNFETRVVKLKKRAANPIDLHNAESSLTALTAAKEKFQNSDRVFTREEAKNIYASMTHRRRFINAMLDTDAMDANRRQELQDTLRLSNSALRKISAFFAENGIDPDTL